MAEVRPDEVSAILREQLSNFKSEAELEEVGTGLATAWLAFTG
jgi:F-type H+-transporting ATPase subunit alpha